MQELSEERYEWAMQKLADYHKKLKRYKTLHPERQVKIITDDEDKLLELNK